MTYNTSYYKQKSKELRDVLVSFRLKKTAIEVVYLQKGFDKMGATIDEASDAFRALGKTMSY